ncbi:hypothetical protein CC80DRAFT_497113 [Byssothecium circinans]|uniref:EF-hand n=1 Tax=Byssothecium circinans TaxID=147558 RepID=A0A6A5TGF5_9PLEO|nr:hypothetical protein CC80DRAFT_497113 [Byssothecium circinans]
MAISAPTSVSRYRPALLVFTGVAAAYGAWLLYTTVQGPTPPPDLHRSNALRRANRRTRIRTQGEESARGIDHGSLERLQQESVPLGEFTFFGRDIPLDNRRLVTVDYLHTVAHENEPTASSEMVEDRIAQLYDTFYDRLLNCVYPDRALSPMERVVVPNSVAMPLGPQALERAMERHRNRFALADTEARLTADGAESIAETDQSLSDDDFESAIDPEMHTLQQTLYHIAEDRARHEGVIHRGITCNGCGNKPIRGIRWHCANCSDFDLCSDCEATNSHYKTHIFYKIRIPAPYMGLPKQEPVYPGRPAMMNPSVSLSLKRRLAEQTRMEAEEIEALWDQFTCLAATEWSSDPNEVGWALDRRAFNHAFIPRYSTFTSVPNLVYDRIFAFFDTDQNALIGFEEFIKGLDGLHSTDTSVKLRIAFNGYDVDGDGYISRKDVLRIFRAHYVIEREATRNYLAESAEELSVRGALETIQSAQPLGSAFAQPESPRVDRGPEPPRRKPNDGMGLEPILDDIPDTMHRATVVADAFPSEHHREAVDDHEALRHRWARRQYYIDEEEGLDRPPGLADTSTPDELEGQINGEAEEPTTPDFDRRRDSRSSSRVRFQDDVDMETRSNASTSSRPIGERWGGYEIPEPEKDLGQEVLYQITQQAFNELLDPLFKDKEDLAMDAIATRAERRLHVTEIEHLCAQFKEERNLNRTLYNVGVSSYAKKVLKAFCKDDMDQFFPGPEPVPRGTFEAEIKKRFHAAEEAIAREDSLDRDWAPNESDLWDAKFWRTQILVELTDALVVLVGDRVLPQPQPQPQAQPSEEKAEAAMDDAPSHDPTMPQFRPNSTADQDQSTQRRRVPSPTRSPPSPNLNPNSPLFISPSQTTTSLLTLTLSSSPSPSAPALTIAPSSGSTTEPLHHSLDKRNASLHDHNSPLHLPFLASLEAVDREMALRGGSGMVGFAEFEEAMEMGGLGFLEGWMDFVSF